MLKYIINQNKKIINLNQYKFSSKTLVDYDNAKSILQTLLSKQTPTQSEQLSINTEISNIMQYHSKYQKSIFYNKELNYLEIRKFNRTLPIEDQKLITQNIINNTPEIESLFWKPIINREYNKCTDKNLMLVGLFSYYNESGRKINPTIGGLYPIFNNNDEYIGFFAFRESERAHGQIEMSLYLKPKIRDTNLGHEIFNYALYLAFIEAKNPESAIILTWSLFNKKIEHIMKKYGLKITDRINIPAKINNTDVSEFVCGIITNEEYKNICFNKNPVLHRLDYSMQNIFNDTQKLS